MVKFSAAPGRHAAVKRIDTSKAEQLAGVKAVITFKDVPAKLYNSSERFPHDKQYLPFDEHILEEKLRFVGDRIAAVAAVTPEIASKALGLIELEYEVLPSVYSVKEALAECAIKLHENGNLADQLTFFAGDIEQGFASADYLGVIL